MSLGPLPSDTDQLVLPAVQTYDDGEAVAWDQPPADGAEPERPAPVVTLVAVSEEGADPAATAERGGDAAAAAGATGAGESDTTARWLGGGGLLLGALGLGLGAGALLRGRRTASS